MLIAAACGGGNDDDRTILTPVSGPFIPQVISSDIAVGENRFVVALLDQDQLPIAGAQLRAEFVRDEDGSSTVVAETDLTAITILRSSTHLHDDGEQHLHEAGELGVYVATVEFDVAGQWQVFTSGTVGGEQMEPTPFLFEVRETPLSPAIGAPAPQSVQLIIDDVDDITEIDTSLIPNEGMHNLTIADAVTSGRPTVITFATPAFCTSQICGPTKEIVDALFTQYSDSVNFIHVEPYDVERVRAGDCQPGLGACLVEFLDTEWGLLSEPWVFTVDAAGNIAGKFEGVVGETELNEHLQELIAG
ncbi:MAG: hypothetical protein IH957_03415 [Chloroflexi bacterium]|nr:hypothetical protein [Chloroflexota bacterium]